MKNTLNKIIVLVTEWYLKYFIPLFSTVSFFIILLILYRNKNLILNSLPNPSFVNQLVNQPIILLTVLSGRILLLSIILFFLVKLLKSILNHLKKLLFSYIPKNILHDKKDAIKPYQPLKSLDNLFQRLGEINLPTELKENYERTWKKNAKLIPARFNNFLKSSNEDLLIIDGPWGSGKTSFLNIAISNFKKHNCLEVYELSAIHYDNVKQIKIALLRYLYSKLPWYVKLYLNIKTFLTHISMNITFKGLSINSFFYQSNLEPTHAFKKLIEDYAVLEKQIIFVFDEIDRLAPNEVIEILKLVYYIREFKIDFKIIIPVDKQYLYYLTALYLHSKGAANLKITTSSQSQLEVLERNILTKNIFTPQAKELLLQIQVYLEKYLTNAKYITIPYAVNTFETLIRSSLELIHRTTLGKNNKKDGDQENFDNQTLLSLVITASFLNFFLDHRLNLNNLINETNILSSDSPIRLNIGGLDTTITSFLGTINRIHEHNQNHDDFYLTWADLCSELQQNYPRTLSGYECSQELRQELYTKFNWQRNLITLLKYYIESKKTNYKLRNLRTFLPIFVKAWPEIKNKILSSRDSTNWDNTIIPGTKVIAEIIEKYS